MANKVDFYYNLVTTSKIKETLSIENVEDFCIQANDDDGINQYLSMYTENGQVKVVVLTNTKRNIIKIACQEIEFTINKVDQIVRKFLESNGVTQCREINRNEFNYEFNRIVDSYVPNDNESETDDNE